MPRNSQPAHHWLSMEDSLRDRGTSMKANHHFINQEGWDFSLWFAILSPLIGICMGLVGLFVLAR